MIKTFVGLAGLFAILSLLAGRRHELPASDQALLAKLDPAVRADFQELLLFARRTNPKARIDSGYRTQAEQDRLYAQGRTTPGPIVTYAKVSYHTSGRALDLGGLSESELAVLGAWWMRKSPKHRWGGKFTNFTDRPHFEVLP
jgi:peptidoglycan L-alanyl-D-glutamate endopeptidase CwlK